MATEGIEGLVVETSNYGATAALWKSLGYVNVFETDHGSGQWVHPHGGPYVFIAERLDTDPCVYPVLRIDDPARFAPTRPVEFLQPFEPQHWGAVEALISDPDGRRISIQAPGQSRD